MRVLVACEFSGIVREAFRARGHDAWSCDLLPSEIPGQHIQDDVIEHINDGWDLMVAHPPCTYLCNSGVCWLNLPTKEDRWEKMETAAIFFKSLLKANIQKIAVENPIMHKYAVKIIGRRQDQIIQPWQFGHGETKATCLWLKGLPKLKPTNVVKGRVQRLYNLPPSPERWKERSRTYQGIANAMAEQWGSVLLKAQEPRFSDEKVERAFQEFKKAAKEYYEKTGHPVFEDYFKSKGYKHVGCEKEKNKVNHVKATCMGRFRTVLTDAGCDSLNAGSSPSQELKNEEDERREK